MATVITFHLVATPDTPPAGQPAGTVVLDVTNSFTMTDDDANRMLAAFQDMMTVRSRGDQRAIDPKTGQPLPIGTPLFVPKPQDCITQACAQLWGSLQSTVQRYYQQLAVQQAQASAPTVGATQDTKVAVGM